MGRVDLADPSVFLSRNGGLTSSDLGEVDDLALHLLFPDLLRLEDLESEVFEVFGLRTGHSDLFVFL